MGSGRKDRRSKGDRRKAGKNGGEIKSERKTRK